MTDDRAIPQPRTIPGVATAVDGVVLLNGPEGLALTMTASAAARTGQNLIDAAAIAQDQAPVPPEDEPRSGQDG